MRQKFKIAFCTAVFLVIFTGLIAGRVAIVDQQPGDLETVLPRTAAEDPSLVFYEDFFYGKYAQVPPGWTSNNGGNLRFYVLTDGYYEFTTDCLLLNDDTGGYAYGYKNFASSVTNGTLEFEFEIENTSAYGSAVKEYHLILRDAGGSTSIITWVLTYTDATQVISVSLQGTAGSKVYSARRIYDVKIVFADSLLDMYVDGALELSGVAYGGQTIQQVYLETTSAQNGGFILVDNIEVRASSLVPEPTLYDISHPIDADTTIDLDWSDISLATYKVFRDRKEIYNVSTLTPIASPSSSDCQDTVSEQGTYWYAIVATNASGDSVPSVSKSVRVDFGMPTHSWTPVLASITPNPDYDGSIDLDWEVPACPKIYNATDQFTGGTITPWVNIYGYLNTAATAEQNVGPFANAMRLVDNNNSKVLALRRTFTAQTTGSVEFWVYPTRTDKQLGINLYDASSQLGPYIKFHSDGNVYAWNGLSRTIPLTTYASHSCYRVRIDYSSSTDLASYYINDTLVASNVAYYESAGNIDRIYISTGEADSDQDVYVTYFGYTGVGSYDLGDNAYGVPNLTNYKVYRNESEILEIGSLSPIGIPTENQFTDIVTENDTYWYGVVVYNGTDSPISNSEDVLVELSIPLASFIANATSIYVNEWVQFNDTTIGGNKPLYYQWNFGDGPLNETTQNVSHQFTSADIFSVNLTVTDFDGDMSVFSMQIEVAVDTTPVASFTASDTEIFITQWIQFNDTTVGGNAPLVYQWNFGDGPSNETTQNVTHQFTSAGVFTVVLTVNDTDGDFSVFSMNITVIPDIYQNGQLITLDPGTHQVTILDIDGTTILMEFSINVLTTMQMRVTVSSENPAVTSLVHALRFFVINVMSGTYTESVLVKFHYSDAGLTDAQESALSAFYLGPAQWDNVGGSVYKSENCVLVTLNHFSTYAVAWTEGEFSLPEMMVWIITIGAAIIIIIAIFKFKGKKSGGSESSDTFDDLFDDFDGG